MTPMARVLTAIGLRRRTGASPAERSRSVASHAALFLGFLGCLLLSSCAASDNITILGYTTGSRFARDIKTIRVPIFENKTFIRGLEFELTEAVIKQIELKSPWKVVQEGADVELRGVIMSMPKRVLLPNQLNEVRQAELTLSVQLSMFDLRTGQPLPTLRPEEGEPPPPPPPPPQPNPLDPLAPLPPPIQPHLPPVMVQKSAQFIVDLGESYATARKQVVQETAEQIVSLLESPW